jgi:hypothetical protein
LGEKEEIFWLEVFIKEMSSPLGLQGAYQFIE